MNRDQEETGRCAVRELTVAEFLDHEIDKAKRRLAALHELRDHLNSAYLNQGASRLAPVFERTQ